MTTYELGPNDRYVMAKVPQNLAPEQLEKGADEIVEKRREIKRLKQEAKDAAGGFRSAIKAAEERMDELVDERKAKKRMVEMQCVEATDFPRAKIVYFPHPNAPNAIKVSELPLSAEEMREPPLFGGAGGGGGSGTGEGKGKKTKKPGGGAAEEPAGAAH